MSEPMEHYKRRLAKHKASSDMAEPLPRPAKIKPIEDTDKIDFGSHTGTPYSDVPASYFHWLWQNGLKTVKPYHEDGSLRSHRDARLADYILRNMAALKKDHPDGIWS